MADWKKIIVSGSSPILHEISGSTLLLRDLSTSNLRSPLVVDSTGNISTGSEYAPAADGTTVGGSSLSNNIAIIGSGSSTIMTASSEQHVDFNSATLRGIKNITSSGEISSSENVIASGYQIGTSAGDKDFAQIRNGSLSIGHDINTELTASGLIIKATGGITASTIPQVNELPFYLGVSSSGEIIKLDQSDVAGGNSGDGIVGVNTGDNLNITGAATTTQEVLITSKFLVEANVFGAGSDSISGSDANIINANFAPNDNVRLKYLDGTTHDTVLLNVTRSSDQGGLISPNARFRFNSTQPGSQVGTERVELYKLVSTNTGVPIIDLNDSINITGSITASGGISASHAFFHGDVSASGNITASNVLVSDNLDVTGNVDIGGVLDFSGFTFSDGNVLVTSGSTTFGDAQNDEHTFTGSVFISASGLTLSDGANLGTITAPSFSGDGSGLTNLDINDVSNFGSITAGDGLTGTTFDGTQTSTFAVNVDGSTLEINSDTVRVKDLGIATGKIADDAVTAAKLADTSVSAGTYGGSSTIPSFTVDAQGRLTAASDNVVNLTLSLTGSDSSKDSVSLSQGITFAAGTGMTSIVVTDDGTVTLNAGDFTSGITTLNSASITNNIDVGGNIIGQGTLEILGNATLGNAAGDITTIQSASISNNLDVTGNAGIQGNLVVNGNTTLGNESGDTVTTTGNLTVGGDLTVNGTTTTINTTNLDIDDRFIALGTGGSYAGKDSGIVFDSSGSAADSIGMALFYDDSENRLAIAHNVDESSMGGTQAVGDDSVAASGIIGGNIVTSRVISAVGTSLTNNRGVTDTTVNFGAGEIVIDSADDIWIYTA